MSNHDIAAVGKASLPEHIHNANPQPKSETKNILPAPQISSEHNAEEGAKTKPVKEQSLFDKHA